MSFENLTADGGVQKRLLKQGAGDAAPDGQLVFCHYTGKLEDGTVFDTSRGKPHLFKFPLGAGMVIKGWDVGIATMQVGEVCELKCAPEYAYGADGTPGGPIPPNATLTFEVELLSVGKEPEGSGGGCVAM